MARPPEIHLPGLRIPILHEDRAIVAIDKPAGWQLAPETARRVENNLHLLLMGSIIAGDRWATRRGIRFLRHVHRLDEDTSGVLLLGRSKGALAPLSRLFADGRVHKAYLAVIPGQPRKTQWVCRTPLKPFDPKTRKVFAGRGGKPAETRFTLLASSGDRSLIACQPITGRTHQIRAHLAHDGYPIVGDKLYGGGAPARMPFPIGLRAVAVELKHPFTGRPVHIAADWRAFAKTFGFDPRTIDFDPRSMTGSAPASQRKQSTHGRHQQQPETKTQRREVRKRKTRPDQSADGSDAAPRRQGRSGGPKRRKGIQGKAQRMPRQRGARRGQ